MKKFKLKNGLTVIADHKDSNVVVIEVCVHVGSNDEHKKIAGITHFLEHMVFEGTDTRTSKEISETIENVGGEMNAATGNERTFFYIYLPKDKAELGLEILSDMMINPIFDQVVFDKEKKVVLEEINMVNDQPSHYQWVMFEKSLYKKYPTKNPVYGSLKTVSDMTRKQMVDYFNTWYVPNNMSIILSGNVKSLIPKVEDYFGCMEKKVLPKRISVKEPVDKTSKTIIENRKINQSYVIMGYKSVPRMNKDSYVLDVIETIFSKGLSGRINDEIRVKRGLAYSAGAAHEAKKGYGFFCFYLNTDKKNVPLCKKIILDEIKKLDNIELKELSEAKSHLVGNALITNEDARKNANDLSFWEFMGDAKLADSYLKTIKSVTIKDIIRVRNKYFKNHTMIKLQSK